MNTVSGRENGPLTVNDVNNAGKRGLVMGKKEPILQLRNYVDRELGRKQGFDSKKRPKGRLLPK